MNNEFNVSDDDLAGDVQGAACAAFDNVAHLVAAGGFDRQDLVRMCVHGVGEQKRSVSILVDEWCRLVVEGRTHHLWPDCVGRPLEKVGI